MCVACSKRYLEKSGRALRRRCSAHDGYIISCRILNTYLLLTLNNGRPYGLVDRSLEVSGLRVNAVDSFP
jgi:hypothetical protein